MTLLLDAEARLFVIPEERHVEAEPARRRESSRQRAAVPPAQALLPAPPASPAPAAGPVAPAARALSPAPARPVSPAPVRRASPGPSVEPLAEPAKRPGAGEQRRTLDDLLSASWEGLSSESAAAACPVCDGELVRRWSAGAGVVGGRCGDCGSELS